MNRRLAGVILCVLCLLAAGLVNPAAGSAVPAAPKPALTISPAIEQLSLTSAQTSYSFQAAVANNTGKPVTLNLSAVDFTSLNTSGGIAFLDSNVNSLSNHHGLASWIGLSPKTLTLAPGAHQSITVTLAGTDTLSPGGHYAAVLLSEGGQTAAGATNRVVINQVISMLVFTSTNGSGTQRLALAKPSLGIAWFHLPQTVNLFLSDEGNTQTTPRGYLTLLNRAGKPLARTILNPGSVLVLPGSTRLFEAAVTPGNRKPFWPGDYHVTVNYSSAASGQLQTKRINFLYIGSPTVYAGTIVLLLLLTGLIRQAAKRAKYRLKQ